MLLTCVFYALTTCLRVAVCVTSGPSSSSAIIGRSISRANEVAGGRGGSGLVLDDIRRNLWPPLRHVLPTQAALLPTTPPNKVITRTTVATLLPSSTLAAIPTRSPIFHAPDLAEDGDAANVAADTPTLRTQLRRGAPGNATVTSRLTATIRETTTVYIETDNRTGTPSPTSTMARYSAPVSDAGQKGGIAGGTVGAVLIVALLTVLCYRRTRRRIRQREGFLSLSDSSSTDDSAELGMVAHGGLFGSDNKTASAVESLAASAPQVPDPAVVEAAEGDRTSEQVPICFRPSRRLVSRYPSLPVTPRVSVRLSDYLNPVIRDTVLLPRPLRRAGRAAPVRSVSWHTGTGKQPSREYTTGDNDSRPPRGSRSRSRSVAAASSVYSSDATFDFAEYVTIGARTSRATTTGQRTSGTTDASGLRSTLANFPRPPPYTFSRGDGHGLGTSWRESFVFSTPEDEVLLAFPKLARQIEDELR